MCSFTSLKTKLSCSRLKSPPPNKKRARWEPRSPPAGFPCQVCATAPTSPVPAASFCFCGCHAYLATQGDAVVSVRWRACVLLVRASAGVCAVDRCGCRCVRGDAHCALSSARGISTWAQVWGPRLNLLHTRRTLVVCLFVLCFGTMNIRVQKSAIALPHAKLSHGPRVRTSNMAPSCLAQRQSGDTAAGACERAR